MSKDLSGAAFPIRGAYADHQDLGMSQRDYFAAHAPESVPDWFKHKPVEHEVPPMPKAEDVDPVHRKEVSDWLDDPVFDLSEELGWFADKVKAHEDAKDAARAANRAARYIQWRWHYADLMIAERSR